MSKKPVTRRSTPGPEASKPAAKAKAPGKISAAFTLSWDGRVIDATPETLTPAQFRRLVAEKVLEHLDITWQPRVIGGNKAEPITGLDPTFLPRGVELELLSLDKRDSGIHARYRVRRRR